MSSFRFEITGLTKTGGALTKRISLTDDGRLVSDGSQCVMSHGEAVRFRFNRLSHFATTIGSLPPNKAISLGALAQNLPDRVEVHTKQRLAKLNGAADADMIARTSEHIFYRPNSAGLILVDFDSKGMPDAVRANLDKAGGPVAALRQVLPELATCGHVIRASTSAGLYRADTGDQMPGSNGVHVYVSAQDGADAERFLRTLHSRCWLAGFGWKMVGAAGQLLDRSIVDRMVFAGERLVFEGAPVLDEPLAQDAEARQPIVHDGPLLDTLAACPPLTIVERAKLTQLQAVESERLASDAGVARRKFIDARSKELAGRGMSPERARAIIEKQCAGVLLPDMVLPFDDQELACITVRDVLAEPQRYVGETLSDPIEGPAYGTGKAKIMSRPDGSLWIHSYAHGRTVYDLKLDEAAVRTLIESAVPEEMVGTYVRLVLDAELGADEIQRLRDFVGDKTKTGKLNLNAMLKEAREQRERDHREQERQRQRAERRDPRPQLPAPRPDAPWLPVMGGLNEVMAADAAAEPSMRDIDGAFVQVRVRRIPNMHAFTSDGANESETEENRLPAPEQPLLTRLTHDQLAEQIERHIDFADEEGRSVHLAAPFVRHYLERTDDALPTVSAISTLPVVLPDGTILAGRGLVRERGIVFRIPEPLMKLLPTVEESDKEAVKKAFKFLTENWLVDVATDYDGKCILIAAALTLMERSLLPERPVFFVTAGRRGGGKTTTLIMLLMAVTGVRPSAAAWSPNEEERRKALLAYLMEAMPAIVWDNIVRGTQVSCPHIERSCTTAFYSDRRLGVSELVAVAAATIHFFTGNNVGPRGDLASRALTARLEVERHDPENRNFVHADPIGWTEAHRGEILRALYTLLIGNPNIRPGSNTAPKTRFKLWWRLIGSAVEHAAEVCGQHIDFRDLFISQEEDDEESASLADALDALDAQWPGDKVEDKATKFQASDVARIANNVHNPNPNMGEDERQRYATVREFLFPEAPPNQVITSKVASHRLKRRIGEPVKRGDYTLILKSYREPKGGPNGALSYYIRSSSGPAHPPPEQEDNA